MRELLKLGLLGRIKSLAARWEISLCFSVFLCSGLIVLFYRTHAKKIYSFKMRFSNVISALAIAAEVACAGRSLKHVGREDRPQSFARPLPRSQPIKHRRETSFPYLTNATASKLSDLSLGIWLKHGRIFCQWLSNSRCGF